MTSTGIAMSVRPGEPLSCTDTGAVEIVAGAGSAGRARGREGAGRTAEATGAGTPARADAAAGPRSGGATGAGAGAGGRTAPGAGRGGEAGEGAETAEGGAGRGGAVVVAAEPSAPPYLVARARKTRVVAPFSVSSTPMPFMATASKYGSPLGFSFSFRISIGSALGRS